LCITSPEGNRKSLFAAHEFLLKTELKDVHPIIDDKRFSVQPRSSAPFLSIIAAGCNHRCFQTSPSGLDQIAPVSVVSSKLTLVVIAAGAAVSEFLDAVAPADRTLLGAGCVM
jgi:hypothetical protein